MLYLQILEQLRKDISNTGSLFVAATGRWDETRGVQLVKKNVNEIEELSVYVRLTKNIHIIIQITVFISAPPPLLPVNCTLTPDCHLIA